jgi:dihydroorotate dehydrogenase
MYHFIRNFLFLLPPEKAHYLTLHIFSFLLKIPGMSALMGSIFKSNGIDHAVTISGMTFKNRVGLAAGFDKDARFLEVWKALGFGHVEVGTVTPKAQPGNEHPRLFRLPKDKAIINRMGFNNQGVEAMVRRLENRPRGLIVGGNIGKNKITPNEKAVDDYLHCFEKLYELVDYFAVNVSSPNTPGLRALQDKDALKEILGILLQRREKYVAEGKTSKPVFLKIAPDLTEGQLDDIIAQSIELQFEGIIATNTTISREGLKTDNTKIETMGAGGLSGKPLKNRSDQVLQYLHDRLDKRTILIGVGGIMSESDARDKFEAGAQLVQIYSGFIYEGPGLVGRLAGVKI